MVHLQRCASLDIGGRLHPRDLTGRVITSGFWSVINEQLDPRTAKQNFGRITGAGTIGGMAGGFISERLGALASTESVLLGMAIAQFVTAALLARLPETPYSPE